MVCNNCEEWQRSARKPQCLVCCYFDKTIYNVRSFPVVKDVKDIDKVKEVVDVEKTIDKPMFIDIFAENRERYESLNIDCEATFGISAIGRFDNEKPIVDVFYFVFKSNAGAKDYFISIRGTKEYAITTFESMYPDKSYIVYTEEEWHTPHRYTKRKPSDCYKKWM